MSSETTQENHLLITLLPISADHKYLGLLLVDGADLLLFILKIKGTVKIKLCDNLTSVNGFVFFVFLSV